MSAHGSTVNFQHFACMHGHFRTFFILVVYLFLCKLGYLLTKEQFLLQLRLSMLYKLKKYIYITGGFLWFDKKIMHRNDDGGGLYTCKLQSIAFVNNKNFIYYQSY